MSARYRLAKPGVIDTTTGLHIKPDRSDPRWIAYLAWFREGNTPDPMDVPPAPGENLDDFYRRQGEARAARQLARLSDAEYLSQLRKGIRR
jgi:hypothetical protein